MRLKRREMSGTEDANECCFGKEHKVLCTLLMSKLHLMSYCFLYHFTITVVTAENRWSGLLCFCYFFFSFPCMSGSMNMVGAAFLR